MKKQQIELLIGKMLEAHDDISDLNLTVDKPLQVGSSGELKPVYTEPRIKQKYLP